MAFPSYLQSSGPISISEIRDWMIASGDLSSTTTVSLETLINASYLTDKTRPHSISQFYGYGYNTSFPYSLTGVRIGDECSDTTGGIYDIESNSPLLYGALLLNAIIKVPTTGEDLVVNWGGWIKSGIFTYQLELAAGYPQSYSTKYYKIIYRKAMDCMMYQINGWTAGGESGKYYGWIGTNISHTNEDSCAWTTADEQIFYTSNSSGNIGYGDILYWASPISGEGIMPFLENNNTWISYYDNGGNRVYLAMVSNNAYVNEFGSCTVDNHITITFNYSAGPGSYSYLVESELAVTSDITITIAVSDDLTGHFGDVDIYLYNGQVSNSDSGSLGGGNPSGISSWEVSGYTPHSDSTYNYII